MTGGRVVVIGPVGRNFAAGMSGGIAFVHDTDGQLQRLCNQDQVALETPDGEDASTIRRLLENHAKLTDSPVAKGIIADWDKELRYFVKVMPTDYRNALNKMAESEAAASRLGQQQPLVK